MNRAFVKIELITLPGIMSDKLSFKVDRIFVLDEPWALLDLPFVITLKILLGNVKVLDISVVDDLTLLDLVNLARAIA